MQPLNQYSSMNDDSNVSLRKTKTANAIIDIDDLPTRKMSAFAKVGTPLKLPQRPKSQPGLVMRIVDPLDLDSYFTGSVPAVRLNPITGKVAAVNVDSILQVSQKIQAATALTLEKGAAAREATVFSRIWFSLVKILFPPLVAFIIPYIVYDLCAKYLFDISNIMYNVVVISLLFTAYFIVVEALSALRIEHPKVAENISYPPASAIIAAYLPNEAETIVETIEHLLQVDYPGEFQLILAYNTPRYLSVEETLNEIARRDRRFVPLRVAKSTSKAQNVNCALEKVTGTFVGIFDADHHPIPTSFTRAWQWMHQGYDVVQGHCVVRNGDNSWVSRLVAVDFELIYALGHAGRARLHEFGIFGGSNGYWRTDLLRKIGMDHNMLTEDIDSSIRAVQQGSKIAYDPLLLSRELAPVTLKALWNQRMRWAQGWFQVTLKHMLNTLRSPHLTVRQKLGVLHLLGWREIYMWLSVQIVPIVAFQLYNKEIEWFAPLYILSTLFTLSIGPLQVLLAYAVAAPDVKKHRRWFIFYAIMSMFFFTGFKNHIARIAHLKEILGEREWKVTPRTIAQVGLAKGEA